MQTFENAHHDPIDGVNAKLEGLNGTVSQTEIIVDQAAEDLSKFSDKFAETARVDLQEVRAEALQGVKNQKEYTQASISEEKSHNLDRELVLSINERFADVPLEERRLFELAIMEESQDNPEYQDKLIDLLSQPDFMFDEGKSPDAYIKKTGLPTSSTVSYFNKEFNLENTAAKIKDTIQYKDANTEKSDANTEKSDANTEKSDAYSQETKILLSSLDGISGNEVAKGLKNILSKFDDPNISKGEAQAIQKEVNEYLGSGEGSQLWELLDSASSDPQAYTNLKASLVGFDPSFDAKIKEYELPLPLAPRDGIEDRNDGSLSLRTYVSSGDGSTTRLDTTVYPPVRTVALPNSEYQLETVTPMTKDIQAISTDFELKAQKIGSRINSLSKLIDVIEKIGQSKLLKIEDIKETLIKHVLRRTGMANNPDLVDTINSASSIDDLKTNILFKLVALKDESQRLLNNEKKEYRKKLAEQYDDYQDLIAENDEQTKEVLTFLRDIGFDLIPQSITEFIIRQLNQNPALRGLLGIDTEIDLPNGKLGFDKNPGGGKGIDELDKKAFASLFNKMIGVKNAAGEEPVNIDSVGTTANPVPDKAEFQTLLNSSGILDIGGAEKAITNLSKSPEEEIEMPEPEEENTDEPLRS